MHKSSLLIGVLFAGCVASRSPGLVVAHLEQNGAAFEHYWHRLPVEREGAEVFIDACTPLGSDRTTLLANYDRAFPSGTRSMTELWAVDCGRTTGDFSHFESCRGEMGAGACEITIDDAWPNKAEFFPGPVARAICAYLEQRQSLPAECAKR